MSDQRRGAATFISSSVGGLAYAQSKADRVAAKSTVELTPVDLTSADRAEAWFERRQSVDLDLRFGPRSAPLAIPRRTAAAKTPWTTGCGCEAASHPVVGLGCAGAGRGRGAATSSPARCEAGPSHGQAGDLWRPVPAYGCGRQIILEQRACRAAPRDLLWLHPLPRRLPDDAGEAVPRHQLNRVPAVRIVCHGRSRSDRPPRSDLSVRSRSDRRLTGGGPSTRLSGSSEFTPTKSPTTKAANVDTRRVSVRWQGGFVSTFGGRAMRGPESQGISAADRKRSACRKFFETQCRRARDRPPAQRSGRAGCGR